MTTIHRPEIALATFDNHPTSRRTEILQSAARSFAAHGFRGCGLREIARNAGVSLTLLNHHFGSKAMLLGAVVSAHHEACLRRIAGLEAIVRSTGRRLDLDRLIDEWVDYEFDLYRTREGKHYLRLMLKLAQDEEVDPTVRRGLNCSESIIVQGFNSARPGLSEEAASGAWLLTSAALYAALLGADALLEKLPSSEVLDLRGLTSKFLLGGLEAFFDNECPDADDSRASMAA
jgi:AcrR family transcriptional regulator